MRIKCYDRVENKLICWYQRLGYMPLVTMQQTINTCQGLNNLIISVLMSLCQNGPGPPGNQLESTRVKSHPCSEAVSSRSFRSIGLCKAVQANFFSQDTRAVAFDVTMLVKIYLQTWRNGSLIMVFDINPQLHLGSGRFQAERQSWSIDSRAFQCCSHQHDTNDECHWW